MVQWFAYDFHCVLQIDTYLHGLPLEVFIVDLRVVNSNEFIKCGERSY